MAQESEEGRKRRGEVCDSGVSLCGVGGEVEGRKVVPGSSAAAWTLCLFISSGLAVEV
jgi:hypothetical protein